MASVFRAQGEAMAAELRRGLVDLAAPRVGAAGVDALWEHARAETAEAFAAGMESLATDALMTGARRFVRAVGEAGIGVLTPPKSLYARLGPGLAPVGVDLDPWSGHADLRGTVFGLDNPRAQKYLSTYGARLVARVDAQTRDLLRGTVTRGIRDGKSSERIGRQIVDLFPQMAEGRPQQHIDSRAHGIAVTEMAFGYEAGQRAVADELGAAGLTVMKSWLTVSDDNVDEDCAENEDAGEIALDDAFPTGDQEPPAHPYCRCTTEYRVVTSDELNATPEPDAQPGDDPALNQTEPAPQPTEPETYDTPEAPPDEVLPPPEPPPPAPEDAYRSAASTDVSRFDDLAPPSVDNQNIGDDLLGEIYARQGFDGPPAIVDSVEDLLAKGWDEGYRGMRRGPGLDGAAGESYATAYREGSYYPGFGVYGNGTYVAQGARISDVITGDFARQQALATASDYAGYSAGEVMRLAINPNARVVTIDAIQAEWQAFRQTTTYLSNPHKFAWAVDEGRFAAARGYDAIYVPNRRFYVILNRTATAVERANTPHA